VAALPGAAQAAVAIALVKRCLPLWADHVRAHPDRLAAVSALFADGHRVRGGGTMIYPGLLAEIVARIEESLPAGAELRRDPIARSYLATLMGPLTNPGWDAALAPPARFVYTAVFNLLVALTYRRVTAAGETHVMVAVNHACSALRQGGVAAGDELDELVRAAAARVPADARDPLVTDAEAADDAPPDPYAPFLTALRREHARCPRCSSTQVREAPVGIEFTEVHCDACGNDELADEWQLDDWYV